MAGLNLRKPAAAGSEKKLRKFLKLQSTQAPTNLFTKNRSSVALTPGGKRAKKR
jgi:hypothetical protein